MKLSVRNWDRWQTYRKDRGQPPWIKLYRTLLRDPEWISLTDAQRGQLASIWMLAADNAGQVPDSPDMIRKLCQLDDYPNLKLFIDHGFLVGCHDDANMASSGCHDDSPETDTETEAERESDTDTKADTKTHTHTESDSERIAEQIKQMKAEGQNISDGQATTDESGDGLGF